MAGESTAETGARVLSTVNLFVEYDPEGKPLMENVLVEKLASNVYRLIKSPGMLEGLAAGDEFELVESEEGNRYRLVRRGGNVCVQFFASEETLAKCSTELTAAVQGLGGRVDGRESLLRVFTIPASAGFPAIEQIFYDMQRRYPDCEWMYGNVYDPKDGKTPLNWWKS